MYLTGLLLMIVASLELKDVAELFDECEIQLVKCVKPSEDWRKLFQSKEYTAYVDDNTKTVYINVR